MKKLCLISTLLLLLLCLWGCGSDSSETAPTAAPPVTSSSNSGMTIQSNLAPQETVDTALLALTKGTEESVPVIVGMDGSLYAPKNTGLSALLSSYTTYNVKNVTTNGDTGVADVTITAPDSVALLKQVSQKTTDAKSAEFEQELAALLANNPPMLNYQVEVSLEKTAQGWGMIPNAELANALTGGLAEEYQRAYEELAEQLAKGGDQ